MAKRQPQPPPEESLARICDVFAEMRAAASTEAPAEILPSLLSLWGKIETRALAALVDPKRPLRKAIAEGGAR